MPANRYKDYSRDQLLKKIHDLEKKRYGLVWEDKLEEVAERCETELPVFVHEPDREITDNPAGRTNILIKGDNYHALFALSFTHRRKIDVIYIDPPYNTGARDWKYNNAFVDKNDRWRHSKWISMMNNRLRLAKGLLKRDGVLIVTIDNNENANLLMLLRELFPGYEIKTIVIEHNPKGLPSKNFSDSHEYAHFLIPKGLSVIGKNPEAKEDTRNLRRAGRFSYREDRPTMFYPIYVRKGKVVRIGEVPEDSFHPRARHTTLADGTIEIWPIDDRGRERRWHFGLESISDYLKRIEVREKDGDWQLYVTAVPGRYKTVWTGGELDAGKYGTSLVKAMTGVEFPFPKSLHATARCLEAVIYGRENATVLDFFAGSGTTGHAVLHLNQTYGSDHKFILCTNNENEICDEVTYPRLEAAIKGFGGKAAIPANLKSFRTDFVPSVLTDNDKRVLVSRSTELLCIAEDTFEAVVETDWLEYAIFRSADRFTAIIYDDDTIAECVEKLNEISPSVQTTIYVFSYDHTYVEEDFDDLTINFRVKPIPEAILNAYRRNARLRKK